MVSAALIFVGSGLGGVARWTLGEWISRGSTEGFPLSTLVVNFVGCLTVGFLHIALEASSMREPYRLAIFVGVLGGFTTYSAFSRETLVLFSDRHYMLAGANVLLSNGLCLGGAWVGMRLASRWFGA